MPSVISHLIILRHMTGFAAAPEFLPVHINIYIPSKDLRFKNVLIKPTDSIVQVKEIVKEQMKKKGDPITKFSKTNIFLLKLPYEGEKEGKEVIIRNEDIPILQYHPEQGSELILMGNLMVKRYDQ